MSNAKKWALGIGLILAAIAGAVVAYLDNDPATVVKPGEVIESVKEGINVIKKKDDFDAAPVGEDISIMPTALPAPAPKPSE